MGLNVNLTEEIHMGIDIQGPPGAPRKTQKESIWLQGPMNGDELYVVAYHSKEFDFPNKIHHQIACSPNSISGSAHKKIRLNG